MSNAVKNVMLRVIDRRLKADERFEDIIKDYPGLAENEINELREELTE